MNVPSTSLFRRAAAIGLALLALAAAPSAWASYAGSDCSALEVVPGKRTTFNGKPMAVGRFYYSDPIPFDYDYDQNKLAEAFRRQVLASTPRLPGGRLVVNCYIAKEHTPHKLRGSAASEGRLNFSGGYPSDADHAAGFLDHLDDLPAYQPQRLDFRPRKEEVQRLDKASEDKRPLHMRCVAIPMESHRDPPAFTRGSEIHMTKLMVVQGRHPWYRIRDEFKDWMRNALGYNAHHVCIQGLDRESVETRLAVFLNRYNTSAVVREAAFTPTQAAFELAQPSRASAAGGRASPGLTIEPARPTPQQMAIAKFEKQLPAFDRSVNNELDTALKSAPKPVPPASAQQKAADKKPENCRMEPDNRGLSTRTTGHATQAAALADARSRVPASCTPTGKTYCDRFADIPGGNKDFLVNFRKHVKDPQYKFSCGAYYTCAHHQRRVCDGPARTGPVRASKQ